MYRLLAIALLFLAVPSQAQQAIFVTTTSDIVDFGGAQQVASLPGPDGQVSFREAVIAANNTVGPQTIGFHIPLSDPLYRPSEGVFWLFFDLFPNTVYITDDGTTIDGTTQTAFTGDTNPSGPEIVFLHCTCASSVPAIVIESDDNVVRHVTGPSLSTTSYDIRGDRNRLEGTIPQGLGENVRISGANNVIGGTAPGAGNRISGGITALLITGPGATGNVVKGNRITNGHDNGIVVTGGASGNVIGGTEPGARNVVVSIGHATGEGNPVGTAVSLSGSNNVFEGNYVGIAEDGSSAAGLAARGVSVSGTGNRIGGTAPGAGNVIGGYTTYDSEARYALVVGGVGTVVQGNVVGVDPVGGQPRPSTAGMLVSSPDAVVGGTEPGAGNVVANSQTYGIGVNGPSASTALLGNVTFNNGGLGIDLGVLGLSDGPTANDLHDPDEGPNRLQNKPVIASAVLSGGVLTVTYSVDTAPANATYPLRVEFFRAGAGGDEGEAFLGAGTYTEADYNAGQPGTAMASLNVSGLSSGALVLATATDGGGNTSEFGPPVSVSGGTAAVSVSAEPVGGPVVIPADGGSFQFRVTLTNTTGQPQTVQAWTAVSGPVSREPVVGPMNVTLPAGATVVRTLTQQVPGIAPAGTYTYHVRVGTLGGAVIASGSFPFTKQGSGARGAGGGDWSVSGWDEAPSVAASSSLPSGFALSEVHPNPSRGTVRLTLEVSASQTVTAAVYDALGRVVAVLHDGAVEAGAHALALDGSSLPAGVYVVRVMGETFSATRRAVLAR